MNLSARSVLSPFILLATAAISGCGGAEPSSTGSSSPSESTALSTEAISGTGSYTCSVPALGTSIPATVVFKGRAPATATAGEKGLEVKGFSVDFTLPADVVEELVEEGATAASAVADTIDVDITDGTSPKNAAKTAITSATVTLVANTAATIKLTNKPKAIEAITAGSAGTMTYAGGEIDFSNVDITGLGNLGAVTCTPPSGGVAFAGTTTVN
jgi:hypothetical protein